MNYAIKTDEGFFAMQGRETWIQKTAKGWASFCKEKEASNVASNYCKENYEIVSINQ